MLEKTKKKLDREKHGENGGKIMVFHTILFTK